MERLIAVRIKMEETFAEKFKEQFKDYPVNISGAQTHNIFFGNPNNEEPEYINVETEKIELGGYINESHIGRQTADISHSLLDNLQSRIDNLLVTNNITKDDIYICRSELDVRVSFDPRAGNDMYINVRLRVGVGDCSDEARAPDVSLPVTLDEPTYGEPIIFDYDLM